MEITVLFDRLIRYLPVLDYIKKHRPLRILEVGSSSRGIGEFYEGEFTGFDMDFPEAPAKNMKAVFGSAEKLPFADVSFDLVFAIDVFEHLPEGMREKAFREMMRIVFGKSVDRYIGKSVNRYDGKTVGQKKAVIIGYPCGRGAEKLSQKMLEWFESRHSGTAMWMREHVSFGLPNEKFQIPNSPPKADPSQADKFQINSKTQNSKNDIRENPLEIRMNRSQNQFSVREFGNENLRVCEALLKLEENGRVLKLERLLFCHFRPLVEAFLRRLNFRKCYRKIWVIEN